MKKSNKRIFVGLCEIAGYYKNLTAGFKSLGVDADFFNLYLKRNSYYAYDNKSKICRLALFLSKKKDMVKLPQWLVSRCFRIIFSFLKLILFVNVLFRYDVFIFGFKRTFLLRYIDLPVLKFFRKKVILVFNGSDIRLPYLSGEQHAYSLDTIKNNTLRLKRDISRLERYSDYVIAIPPIAHFFKKPILNYVAIGRPLFFQGEDMNVTSCNIKSTKQMTIVHAPSNPVCKGTDVIRKILNQLEAEGYCFKYVEIVNKTNVEVVRLLRQCDFVIDQTYSDYPLPGVPCEAAWFGKPSIVAGYELNQWTQLLKDDDIPPSMAVRFDDLKGAIVKMLTDTSYRVLLGKKAFKFAHERWTAKEVAKRYLAIIDDNVPSSWYYHPNQLAFLYGAGCSDESRKKIINAMVAKYGKDVLQLSDMPEFQAKLLKSCE